MPGRAAAADVAVVGGGVIGVFAAWELARRGARVTVFDRGPLGLGSSFGNAGLLTAGAALPVSTPAALATGARSLAGLASGISLRRPRNREELRFLASFTLAARRRAVRAATKTLRELASTSLDLYRQVVAGQTDALGFAETGWLHVYRTERALAGGLAEADALARLGVRWELLDAPLLRRRETALREDLVAGINYLEDAIVEPHRLLRAVGDLAAEASVELRPGVDVRSIRH
ncbi:MAG: NAD(P)/FAD-dependent oxidoreductase, partial [Candidatus Dormibacteraceae bacterium]